MNIVFKIIVMKKFIIVLTLVMGSVWLVAQNGIKVPEVVSKSFDAVYPGMQEVSWKKKNGNYEAKFGTGVNNVIVRVSEKGDILETEVETPFSVLPNQIAYYLIQNYPELKMSSASLITKADKSQEYKAEAGEFDFYFTKRGQFIRMEERSPDESEFFGKK